MKEFIAKFGDRILGVLSGFDRLVLRGTLRAIVYAQGMEAYLEQNHVLLKNFAQHVGEVSRQLKQASLAAAEKTGRTVKYLASSTVSKEETARAIAAGHHRGAGLRAELRRALPELRGVPQPGEPAIGVEVAAAQMSVFVPLLDASGFRFHECAHPDLVSVFDSDLPQRARVAGATDGRRGLGVRTPRQLLSLD